MITVGLMSGCRAFRSQKSGVSIQNIYGHSMFASVLVRYGILTPEFWLPTPIWACGVAAGSMLLYVLGCYVSGAIIGEGWGVRQVC